MTGGPNSREDAADVGSRPQLTVRSAQRGDSLDRREKFALLGFEPRKAIRTYKVRL